MDINMKYIIACLLLFFPVLNGYSGAPKQLPNLEQPLPQQQQQQYRMDDNHQIALLQREIKRLNNVIIDLRVERDQAQAQCMHSVNIHLNWLQTMHQSIKFVEDEIVIKHNVPMPQELIDYKQQIQREMKQYGILPQ